MNLTILTTCISRGRTYYLPHDFDADDPGDRFWFDPDELQTTPLEARGKPLTRTFASVGGGTHTLTPRAAVEGEYLAVAVA